MIMVHNETPYTLMFAPFGPTVFITLIIAVVCITLRLFPVCNGFLYTKNIMLPAASQKVGESLVQLLYN
jgi:hypothetical protein